MALAQRKVAPLFSGPQLKAYAPQGSMGGGAPAAVMPQQQQAPQQINPVEMLTLWKMLGLNKKDHSDTGTVPAGDSSFTDYGAESVMGKELADSDNFYWMQK